MQNGSRTERLLGTTRGRILGNLCGSSATARELAERLGISGNAVHVHLGILRRAGLVDFELVRRGRGKPAHLYELTPEGDYLLSRAYVPVLQQLLAALDARYPSELEGVLRAAGRGVAASYPKPAGGPRRRAAAAAQVVNDLGGSARVEPATGELRIRSECCPLSGLTPQLPQICKLMESLLGEVTGTVVEERCDRSGRPRCVFLLEATRT